MSWKTRLDQNPLAVRLASPRLVIVGRQRPGRQRVPIKDLAGHTGGFCCGQVVWLVRMAEHCSHVA
jgi:hypothetical protein